MKILLILFTILNFPALPIFPQQPLELKVIMQKDTYLEGEIIDIGLSLKNNDTISVGDERCGIGIQIIDTSSRVLPYVGPSDSKFLSGLDYVKPNDEAYQVIDLTSNFGEHLLHFGFAEHYFNQGNYKLDIIYYKPDAKPEHSIIPFRVISPEGEELTVYNKLLKITSTLGTPQYTDTNFVNGLMNLHKEHPKSIYTPIILDIAGAWYSSELKEPITAKEIDSELVEKYSWSSRGRGYLDYILKEMASSNARAEFLRKILPNSKNSVMQKYIEKIIKKEQVYNDKSLLKDTCVKIDDRFALTLSAGGLNSSSLAGVITISAKLGYKLTNKYQIVLLYRTGGNFFAFGATDYTVEAAKEINNEIYSYHEISPMMIYNLLYEDTYFYFGSGISFIWGIKQDFSRKYNQFGLPFAAGFNVIFSDNISGGI